MFSSLFSSGNQKQTVGIALTPGIGLEAVIIDKTNGTVTNYGRKKVEYNFKTREIDDYPQFKSSLIALMDEMKIAAKTPVYLILPNVYFSFTEIPLTLTDNDIKNIVLSNAEEFYLFKKDEPASGWCEIPNPDSGNMKKIAYTSFQKSAIDEIKEIFNDAGLKLIGIESAYSATLRGLHTIGMIDESDLVSATWTAMMINTNSFTLFNMEGKTLLEYSEVPLAIKSFSTEEAYAAIVSSASQLLSNYDSSKLYIISQTDDICAEALKKQMQFDREIIAIDSNKFSKQPLIEVLSALDFNEANSLTLAVIGAANFKSSFGLTLNVLAEEAAASSGIYMTTVIGGKPVEITKELITNVAVVIIMAGVVLLGGTTFFFYSQNNKNQDEISSIKQQIQTKEAAIQELKKAEEVVEEKVEEVDMTSIIDEVAEQNVTAIKFFDSIATDIPKNVWLIRYYNKMGSGTDFVVRGIAESIVDIYEYYKNLKITSPQTDISIQELKVVAHDVEGEDSRYIHNLLINKDTDRLYRFQIGNTNAPSNNAEDQPKEDESDVLATPPAENIEATSSEMVPEEE